MTELSENQQAVLVLEELSKAWAVCRQAGVSEAILRTATLTAALTSFVMDSGEDVTAEIFALLPAKIRKGDFSPRPAPASTP